MPWDNKERKKLKPIIKGILPSITDDILLDKVIDNLEDFLEEMDEEVEKNLKLLIKVIDILASIRNLKSLKSLTEEEIERFFNWLYNFPIGKIAAGFNGLRAIILMSYYSLEESWDKIGYDGPIVQRSLL